MTTDMLTCRLHVQASHYHRLQYLHHAADKLLIRFADGLNTRGTEPVPGTAEVMSGSVIQRSFEDSPDVFEYAAAALEGAPHQPIVKFEKAGVEGKRRGAKGGV